MSPELVRDIHDEHSDSINRFEELVPELIDEFWLSELSLLQYLDGPYRTRMDNVLAEQCQPLSPDNIAGITELGVRLEAVEIAD